MNVTLSEKSIGDFFLTRDGSIAVVENFNDPKPYVADGIVKPKNTKNIARSWMRDGSCYFSRDDKYDLIKKITQEKNPEYFI